MKLHPSIYKVTKLFMIGVGIWISPFGDKSMWKNVCLKYSLIVRGVYFVSNASLIVKAVILVFHHTEHQNVFGIVSLMALITMINIKVVVYKKSHIPELFKTIAQQEDSFFQTKADAEYIEYCNYFNKIWIIQIITTTTSVYLYIIFHFYKKFTNQLLEEENFMYELWIPFIKNTNNFVFIVIKLILSQMGILFHCTVEMVMLSLMIFIDAQLKMLQAKVKKLSKEDRVRNIIHEHQFIIQFVERLNKSINYVILIE
ncbi:hypothetical protein ABEB36_014797 [Hypothenemus hampei]|uniref:Uncharacterized protein n=1 Tax=Hypothenemus hampei TaxID=57062 RepID=A0ABD1E0Y4_HYPHA